MNKPGPPRRRGGGKRGRGKRKMFTRRYTIGKQSGK
jgi:hypothetical protein